MKKSLIILSIILSTMNCKSQDIKNNFDFTGMDIFWEIVDYLENDQSAPEELWEKLNKHPGYRTAMDVEFGKNYFKYFYELAFMPSKIEERDARIKRGGFFGPYLEHLIEYKDHENDLKKLQIKLTGSPELYNNAIKKCRDLLPDGVYENNELPKVSFIAFGPDGRGYKPILVDPLYFITKVYDHENFLAHEFHHHYIKKKIIFRDGEEVLNWAFGQIYKEGIADLINIPEEVFIDSLNSSKRAVKYRELFAKTNEIILKVDSLLSNMYLNQVDFYVEAKKVRDAIPMAGHTIGYFMASYLLIYSGKESVLMDFGNPYKFILRYNQIAIKNNLPSFSNDSIKLLIELDLKYS